MRLFLAGERGLGGRWVREAEDEEAVGGVDTAGVWAPPMERGVREVRGILIHRAWKRGIEVI